MREAFAVFGDELRAFIARATGANDQIIDLLEGLESAHVHVLRPIP